MILTKGGNNFGWLLISCCKILVHTFDLFHGMTSNPLSVEPARETSTCFVVHGKNYPTGQFIMYPFHLSTSWKNDIIKNRMFQLHGGSKVSLRIQSCYNVLISPFSFLLSSILSAFQKNSRKIDQEFCVGLG